MAVEQGIIEYISKSNSNKREFMLFNRITALIKDPLPDNVQFKNIINRLEQTIPEHLFYEIDMVIVGQFPELKQRDVKSVYMDGAIYASNEQKSEQDLYDDIVHEIAHSIEEPYGYQIYGDQEIKAEFLRKRKILHDKLWALGHKAPLEWFMNTEYDQEFDEFLLKTIGYDKLRMICMGLFISAYAPTSLREYFATGFTDFYLYPNHGFLQKVSPVLTKKLILLQDVKNLDNSP